jgi:hypothetical protein
MAARDYSEGRNLKKFPLSKDLDKEEGGASRFSKGGQNEGGAALSDK